MIQFHLKRGDLKKAAVLAAEWERESKGIVKFENLSLWLSGKILRQNGDLKKAEPKLETALQRSKRYRLPYLEFQVSRELTLLAIAEGDEERFQQLSLTTQHAFQKLLNGVGDEILQRQMEESIEYESFLKLGG